MKKILILSLFTVLSAVFSTSCSDNESIENEAVTQESSALRMMINEMKKSNTSNKGMGVNGDNFFIDFVYPINLSFNNGTVITVSSQEGLISILNNETSDLYITGIAFPFQLVVGPEGTIVTINNEDEFWEFIEDQDLATYDDYVFSGSCYEFVYPLSFINANNQTITVANETELLNLFTNPNQGNLIVNFVYPFSVISEGQIIVIDNELEFYEINEDCFPVADCNCPTVYDPVCVQTFNGQVVLQYPNACQAECDGYTSADFFNCNAGSSIWFSLGSCFSMSYPVQVQMEGTTTTVNNNNQLLYAIFPSANNASLVFPVTVTVIATNAQFTFLDQATMNATLSNVCN